MQPELINIENRMKQIVCYLMLLCACMQLQAQTYDELITCALDAAKNDSLTKSEILFKQALKMDPANMRNALLFTNLGTVQRRFVHVILEYYSIFCCYIAQSCFTLFGEKFV